MANKRKSKILFYFMLISVICYLFAPFSTLIGGEDVYDIQLFNHAFSKPSIFKGGYIEGAKLIGADRFAERGNYGEGITVAVIDSGCDINHPNLKDRIIGYKNFTNDDNGNPHIVTDYTGHGTHVCGIIGASDIGNDGIIGVAPKCNLLVLKALSKNGGKSSWVANAIKYAILYQNVDIISMSLGANQPSQEMRDAIQEAIKRGIVVVVAAGNNGDNNSQTMELNYPASFNECITVGSVTYSKRNSRFTATSREIDLVALGEGYNSRGVLSTYPNGLYKEMKGTSMATPFVSGALALLKNWFKKEFGRTPTESELYAQLIKCTVDLDMPKTLQGNGMLYLCIEDITDKLIFNDKLIEKILNDEIN